MFSGNFYASLKTCENLKILGSASPKLDFYPENYISEKKNNKRNNGPEQR